MIGMFDKTDVGKMFAPLPEGLRKRYIARVQAAMETEKDEKAVALYVARMLFHDFVKPIDMMNAISKFASYRKELAKGVFLESPEISLTKQTDQNLYSQIRADFFQMIDKLGFTNDFKTFWEIDFNFLRGE